ncbi:WSC domain-containing protein [Lindgomyces ingoldianus]|uniref:WSC domain-containing protein n=1 Tax=Lindgomyces ingoldianus TaxID=673940 RepID=A0ACB6QNX2_9PLEO|nr:WSC domain-containing protein [Lindgomyces ingoldianus]KAF2467856.1 WSC domain-containing protein [Lindgomyces ingoldianus]
MKSATSFAAIVGLLSGAADAFWRMECHSRTGLARIDPLVEPNEIANHGHVIHGGSNFGMDTTYADLRASECTSCRVKEDKSAYWTPSMNFIFENGTTVLVPQVGGMLAYYLLYGENIKAFPANFRMLAGDTRLRNFSGPVPDPPKSNWGPEDKTQFALGQKALGFNCLNYAKTPEGSMYRHFLPDKQYMDENCADGIRAEIFFPSCWNGKDLDAKNHKDHMAYPDLVNDGTCPEGFDTRVPSMFFETIWNTAAFKGQAGQFVFSNGDPTGYGYHGDFMTGWDPDFLQTAVNDCTNPSGNIADCRHFTLQTEAEGAKCTFKMPDVLKEDNCAGPADGLCGNVPIQAGPEYASLVQPGDSATPTGGYTPPATTELPPVPTLSYKAPTSAVTDKYGGGISVAAINAGLSQASEVAIAATSTPVVSEAPPFVTSAPVVPEQPQGHVISTSTYTSAGTVYEVAIMEVDITVTVEPTPAARHRRHVHHMHRRDREHGLLGRY